MTLSKLATTGLALAALALPLGGSAQDAKPGEFKIPGTDTTIKLNGFVEADIIYDFDGADEDIRGSDWASFLPFQPLDDTPDQEDQPNRLYFTARTSRVGLTTNTPTGLGPLTVRVEGDFNSPSAFNYSTEATTNGTNFRIRHAYGEFAGFLVGQTWSNFMDLLSLPDTVDFNPHGAFALTRQPMIRYALKLGGSSTLSVSAENPQSVVIGTEVLDGNVTGEPALNHSLTVGRRYDRFPDVTGSLTIPFAMGHLNLRGVALEYNGQVPTTPPATGTGAEDSRWGWGVGASGSLKFGPATLVASVQGGDGIGRYMFTTLFQGAAFDTTGDIALWRSMAYHAGLTWAWSKAARSNVIWTQTFIEENDDLGGATSGENEQLDALFANTFVSPVKNTEIGVEYVYGQRQTFNGGEGTQHRVNALFRYTFF